MSQLLNDNRGAHRAREMEAKALTRLRRAARSGAFGSFRRTLDDVMPLLSIDEGMYRELRSLVARASYNGGMRLFAQAKRDAERLDLFRFRYSGSNALELLRLSLQFGGGSRAQFEKVSQALPVLGRDARSRLIPVRLQEVDQHLKRGDMSQARVSLHIANRLIRQLKLGSDSPEFLQAAGLRGRISAHAEGLSTFV